MSRVEVPDMTPEEKLNQLIDEWQLPLLRTCCMLLGDADLARDAVQETFVKVWHALPTFRGECSEKTWLMRITINTCRDMKRNAWFRIVDKSISPEDLPEPSYDPWTEDREVFSEVLALPLKMREVTLMYYYHNMSTREIAEALRISQPAVTKRMKAARLRLKSMLKEEDQ